MPSRLAIALALFAALPLPLSAQPLAVTDMEGREVRLARPAERVASIPIPMASTLIALDGSTRRLVGMNPLALSAIEEGILGRIFPEARRIPANIAAPNFVPNIEALAATRPDLVIQWGGRGPDIVRPIENAGLTAMLILYGTEDRTRRYMRDAATLIGRPERIGPLVAWREEVQARLSAGTAAIPPDARPRVLYLQRALSGLLAAGADPEIYNHFVIELAGGRNAAEGLRGFTPVNREQIAAWNPDVILLNSFEDALTTDFVLRDPVLSLTTAARRNAVYKMPLGGYRWDPPSQESPLSWMWLAMLLHPDRFAFDLRAEMRAAFRTLYGHDLTEAETDEILRLGTQGNARHYAAFRAR
ncbi:MAG: ABC transporter substrate-binding protein [Acetobacteraceae bacterium]|nr:ABC transporter substrate-binding protein [Acetobacteraceae bacterium]MCX7686316.1 ABC transporter substrate-binding protein [Acetobacteraceae bacterium]MDW8398798.1 ABC transporter substrate-binding protein [Acetobacteraceae bacterium]